MGAEPEPADAMALIRAHIRGDDEAINALCAMLDLRALFAVTVGVFMGVLEQGGIDPDALDRACADWQRRQYTGD